MPNPRGISKAARDFLWRWELDSSVHPKIWSPNDWKDGCNSKGREERGKWRTDRGRGTFIWEHFFPDVGKGRRRKRERENLKEAPCPEQSLLLDSALRS